MKTSTPKLMNALIATLAVSSLACVFGSAEPSPPSGTPQNNAPPQNNAAGRCGDGVREGAELCDGDDCPTPASCQDNNACTLDALAGAAATCDAICVNTPITQCAHEDGCCPEGCTDAEDNDCAATPGELVVGRAGRSIEANGEDEVGILSRGPHQLSYELTLRDQGALQLLQANALTGTVSSLQAQLSPQAPVTLDASRDAGPVTLTLSFEVLEAGPFMIDVELALSGATTSTFSFQIRGACDPQECAHTLEPQLLYTNPLGRPLHPTSSAQGQGWLALAFDSFEREIDHGGFSTLEPQALVALVSPTGQVTIRSMGDRTSQGVAASHAGGVGLLATHQDPGGEPTLRLMLCQGDACQAPQTLDSLPAFGAGQPISAELVATPTGYLVVLCAPRDQEAQGALMALPLDAAGRPGQLVTLESPSSCSRRSGFFDLTTHTLNAVEGDDGLAWVVSTHHERPGELDERVFAKLHVLDADGQVVDALRLPDDMFGAGDAGVALPSMSAVLTSNNVTSANTLYTLRGTPRRVEQTLMSLWPLWRAHGRAALVHEGALVLASSRGRSTRVLGFEPGQRELKAAWAFVDETTCPSGHLVRRAMPGADPELFVVALSDGQSRCDDIFAPSDKSRLILGRSASKP